jgi:hypothetical protein
MFLPRTDSVIPSIVIGKYLYGLDLITRNKVPFTSYDIQCLEHMTQSELVA